LQAVLYYCRSSEGSAVVKALGNRVRMQTMRRRLVESRHPDSRSDMTGEEVCHG
jgi:hypothetical protein